MVYTKEIEKKWNKFDFFMVFATGICAGVLLIIFAWGFYEHGADVRYRDCMYDFANESCQAKGELLDSFAVKYSAYSCKRTIDTGFVIIPELQPPGILTETHIGICWNRSGSMMKQFERDYVE